MRADFSVGVSRHLAPEQFAAAIVRIVPAGLRVDVRADLSPDAAAAVAAIVGALHDPCWPCTLSCVWHSDALGPYPDVRLANELWASYGVDCFCDVYPFAGEFDPHDPYWWMACVGGNWYLADMTQVPAITGETSGSGIRLVRPIHVPDGPAVA